MRFIIGGEGAFGWVERMTYRGAIGIFYTTTWEGVLTYIIAAVIVLLAIIGLFTVLKYLFSRKKSKESAHDRWLRTGKYK